VTVEYIRYAIPADRADAFERDYATATAPLTASPNCLSYELSRCVEEPEHYILRIEWDSLDGHLKGFRQGPEFRTFFQMIRPYVGDIAEMRHYDRVLSSAPARPV
jgi:quinol monooxygenase YgiN